MTTAYRAGNAEMHDEDRPYPHLHLLDGTPTGSLARVLSNADQIIRRAILAVLAGYTAPTG